jgi:hypothetical protein
MTSGASSDTTIANSIAKILKEKQSIAICLPTQTTLDATAAALSLFFALENEDKSVCVACATPIDPSYNLIGQEDIRNNLSVDGDVLVVSIPYKDGHIENVSYAVDGDKLNIAITPGAGKSRLQPEAVSFNYTGGKPEVIVTLYTPTLQALGALYEGHQDQFQGVEVINIDRHFTNSEYGTINFLDKKSPSMVQMINELLRALKTEIDQEIASNLYDGLVSATNNFSSYTINAQAFRMAAFLLEHGATRRPAAGAGNGAYSPQGQPVYTAPAMGASPEGESYDLEGTAEYMEQPQPAQAMAPQPIPAQPPVEPVQPVSVSVPAPGPRSRPAAQQPVPQESNPQEPAPAAQPAPAEPPQEKPQSGPVQLKPQIFKGSSGLNKG